MKTIKIFFNFASVLVIGLSALSIYAAGQPPAVFDIELGSDISKIIQNKRFKCKRTNSPVAEHTCRLLARYKEEIYEVPLSTLTLNFFNNRLSTIVATFENTHFNAVREGLEQDYGPYQERLVERYVTRRARVFKGYVYIWADSPFFINAIEHFSTGGDSAVLYKLEPNR